MQQTAIEKYVVDGLLSARRSGQTWKPDRFDAGLTMENAYRVQQQLAAELGWFDSGHPALWKAGGNPPMAAPLPDVLFSGANWSATGHDSLALEAEIAFRLNKTPTSAADILACIGTICVCIELVATRLSDGMRQAPVPWRVADQQMHAGLVIGKEIPWSARDWSRQRCQVIVNEASPIQATGTHPIGNPLSALGWLVNHAAQYYDGLCAGDLITTGAWIVQPVRVGDRVYVQFNEIGSASITIVA